MCVRRVTDSRSEKIQLLPRGSGPTKFESSFVAVSGGGDEPIGGNTPPRRWNGVTWSEETPDVARVVRACERAGRRTRTISCPLITHSPRARFVGSTSWQSRGKSSSRIG